MTFALGLSIALPSHAVTGAEAVAAARNTQLPDIDGIMANHDGVLDAVGGGSTEGLDDVKNLWADGKGTLTVENGEMTIHVSLASTSILNLFPGTAEDAQKEGAELLQPTTDTVTYSDGLSEEVYGFDIPVPALDEEFDLALIGKKGTWYDHKVSVSNPVPVEESGKTVDDLALADGTYTAELTFAGGSGKAYIQSPCTLTVADGKAVATVVWSSSKYDYMLVDGERYDVLTTEPGSTFEIPVAAFDTELTVIGDTTAMSTPHEIEYTLNFDSATLTAAE